MTVFFLFTAVTVFFISKWALFFKNSDNAYINLNKIAIASELTTLLIIVFQLWFGFAVSKYPPLFANVAGSLILFIGVCIATWARIVLRENYRPMAFSNSDYPARIVSSGPYRFLRHPTYFGTFLVGIGFEIALWSILIIPVLFTIPIFIHQILKEEKALVGHFPVEWQVFSQRTRCRFIPFMF